MPSRFLGVVLSALAALGAAAAHAQPTAYVASPRVGEEIDATERDYFGLFPGVDGFRSARFTSYPDSVVVTIQRAGTDGASGETGWVMSRERAAAIGAYIDSFENLDAPTDFAQWQLLRGTSRTVAADAAMRTPGLGDRRPDVGAIVAGRRYDGAILAASDTLLLLHPAARPYDWRDPDLLALDPATIDWVRVQPVVQLAPRLLAQVAITGAGLLLALPLVIGEEAEVQAAGVFAGLVAGYSAGRAVMRRHAHEVEGPYDTALPALRARARFRFPVDLSPAEAAARGRGSNAITPVPDAPPGAFQRWRKSYGWMSVALLGPGAWYGVATEDPGTFTETFLPGVPVEQGVVYDDFAPSFGVDIAARPVPWVRAGVVWQRVAVTRAEPRQGQGLAGNDEHAIVEPGTLRGYAEAVLPVPRAGGFGLDVSAGVGVLRDKVAVERVGFIGVREIAYRYEDSVTAMFLHGTVELVTPRQMSFFLRYIAGRDLPALDVEGEVIGEPGFPTLYTREAHTVEFAPIREITFGTRFRF